MNVRKYIWRKIEVKKKGKILNEMQAEVNEKNSTKTEEEEGRLFEEFWGTELWNGI